MYTHAWVTAIAVVLVLGGGWNMLSLDDRWGPRGAPVAAAQGFGEEESKYMDEVENTLQRFQWAIARLKMVEGEPQPEFDAARKVFGEKEQALQKALSAMRAAPPDSFYDHKPAVDAALRDLESAYQRAEQAFH